MTVTPEFQAIIIDYIRNQILSSRTGEKIDPDENIFTSGLVDSVGMMQLIAFIEKRFEFKVPPQDLLPENFMTIATMARYFEGQINDRASGIA